jgi:hypothetical protein
MMAGSIWVCNIAWLDFENKNLIDIDFLTKVEPMEEK